MVLITFLRPFLFLLNLAFLLLPYINMSQLILQGITLSEFEALIKTAIAERITEVTPTVKYVSDLNETNKYLTRREAAKKLNLSLPTLAKYSVSGLIPYYRIGSRILYKQEEIEQSLQTVQVHKYRP